MTRHLRHATRHTSVVYFNSPVTLFVNHLDEVTGEILLIYKHPSIVEISVQRLGCVSPTEAGGNQLIRVWFVSDINDTTIYHDFMMPESWTTALFAAAMLKEGGMSNGVISIFRKEHGSHFGGDIVNDIASIVAKGYYTMPANRLSRQLEPWISGWPVYGGFY